MLNVSWGFSKSIKNILIDCLNWIFCTSYAISGISGCLIVNLII
jgi:hypothetical protein